MEYRKIQEAAPERPNIAKTLRELSKLTYVDCVVFSKSQSLSVRNTMSRLKKNEGYSFISEIKGKSLKVWNLQKL